MNKIYLKMFLDKNLGDDLMLYLLSLHFENSETVFYVDCPLNLEEFYSSMLNGSKCVKLIQCHLRDIYKNYPRDFFNNIVQVGGSVLMGNTLKGCWFRFLNSILFQRVRKEGINYIIVGCNIGPFRFFLAELFVRMEIRSAQYISIRDNASFNYVRKYSPNSIVQRYSDIVFSLPEKTDTHKKRHSIGIAVYGPKSDYLTPLLSELSQNYTAQGGNVFLFCFNAGTQNDLCGAQSIKQSIEKNDNIYIVNYCGNIPQFLSDFSSCERILAIRFHAAILSEHFNIPYITISYNNKMHNFMSDNGNIEKNIPIIKIPETNADDVLNLLINDPVIPHPERFMDAKCHYEFLQKILMDE